MLWFRVLLFFIIMAAFFALVAWIVSYLLQPKATLAKAKVEVKHDKEMEEVEKKIKKMRRKK